MRTRAPAVLTLALAASATAAAFEPSPLDAAATCSIEQITETTGIGNFAQTAPAISGNGDVIAFASSTNITSGNADGNQEIVRYVRSTDTFSQVTSTTGGTFANRDPQLSRTGGDLLFTSDRNILGTNPDTNREVFHHRPGPVISLTEALTQTEAPDLATGPAISADGSVFAFTSSGDPLSTNADGNFEVFYLDTDGDGLVQVTTTTGGDNGGAALDAGGTQLVFSSENAIDGANADGSVEIFAYSGVTGAVRPRTAANLHNSQSPALSDNGRRMVFTSTADFAGRNPDGNEEVVLREDPAATLTVLQPNAGGAFGPGSPAINAAGTRVVFDSDDDLVGENADGGSEIYLRDFGPTGRRTTQVTDLGTAGAGEVAVDDSGRRIVFSSQSNLTGDNADGNREIYLATCSAPPVPARCDGQLVTVDRTRGQQPTTANDVIRGTNGADTTSGKGGNDRFCGRNGGDVFSGGPGADRAFGEAGNDRLRGDGGNELLDGGTGSDALNGGPGADTCRGGPGTDAGTACEARLGIP